MNSTGKTRRTGRASLADAWLSHQKIDILRPQWWIKDMCENYFAVEILGGGKYQIQFHRHGPQMECIHSLLVLATDKGEISVLLERNLS